MYLFDISALPPIPTSNRPVGPKMPKHPFHSSAEANKLYSELRKKTKTQHEEKLLEERLQRLERELSHSQAFSNLTPSAGSVKEM